MGKVFALLLAFGIVFVLKNTIWPSLWAGFFIPLAVVFYAIGWGIKEQQIASDDEVAPKIP